MRTTVDLPEDLHGLVQSLARDTSRTMSETVVDLMRRGLSQALPAEVARSAQTGLPVVSVGRVITSEDVRSLDDDDDR